MAIKICGASNRRLFGLSAVLLLASGAQLQADTSSFMAMFRKKSAASPSELQLKAEHGPWLILAATLSGDDAQIKATKLANEIRTSINVPAFVMKKEPVESDVLGVGERIVTNRHGQLIPKQVSKKYANGVGSETFAVLVGEFSSTEDPRIKEVLEAVRVAQPVALGATGNSDKEEENRDDSAWLVRKTRSLIWWKSSRKENLKKGPMGAAFVTRNPLLPDDFFQTPQVDDFVAKLNKQVEYSLLDCPRKFTVRVASFHGHAITEINGEQSGLTKTSSALDKAAEQANKLTLALRAKGTEAYQFHDRYGSYVMIGSFDKLGDEVATGVFRYNPAMLAIMEEFCGYRVLDVKEPRTGAISRQTSLKSLDKIPFDIEGKPMAVPRPQSNNLYKGSLLGSH